MDITAINIIKTTSVFIFLLLFGCAARTHWAFDQIHAEKKFCSTKLIYHSLDPVSGIDLELLKTNEHLQLYLNIYSIPIPPYQGNQEQALITIEHQGQKTQSLVHRMRGGQRFLLPQPIATQIIESLKAGSPVTIRLASYRTVFQPEDFSNKFHKLLHPSVLKNPFHLPTT